MTVDFQSKASVSYLGINLNCQLIHCYNYKSIFLHTYDGSLTAMY